MTRTRRTTVIGSFLVLAGVAIAAQAPPPPAPRDPQREVAMSVADGFTLAAVGDCIAARPVSQTQDPTGRQAHSRRRFGVQQPKPRNRSLADAGRAPGGIRRRLDHRAPSVAQDLQAIGFDVMSRANNHATDWGLEA